MQNCTALYCRFCFRKVKVLHLEEHIDKVHTNPIEKANANCDFVATSKDNLLSCAVCAKTFRERRDLAGHILYFHQNHRTRSKYCDNTIKFLKILFSHFSSQYSMEEDLELDDLKQENCKICKSKFQTESSQICESENSCNKRKFKQQNKNLAQRGYNTGHFVWLSLIVGLLISNIAFQSLFLIWNGLLFIIWLSIFAL